MSNNLTSIDISHMKLPDLFRIVEEVQTTKTPRILKPDSEPVAILMPVGTTAHRSHPQKRTIRTHYDPRLVRAALKTSAGAKHAPSFRYSAAVFRCFPSRFLLQNGVPPYGNT